MSLRTSLEAFAFISLRYDCTPGEDEVSGATPPITVSDDASEPSSVGQSPGTDCAFVANLKFGFSCRIAFISWMPFSPSAMLAQSALEVIDFAMAGALARLPVAGSRNGPTYLAPPTAAASLFSCTGTLEFAPASACASAIALQPFRLAR